jgi:hypothetical protein
LALFGRRSPQRVDSLVMPASENLHTSGLMHRRKTEAYSILVKQGGNACHVAPRSAQTGDRSERNWVSTNAEKYLHRASCCFCRESRVEYRQRSKSGLPAAGLNCPPSRAADHCGPQPSDIRLVYPDSKEIRKLRLDADSEMDSCFEHDPRRLS